MSEAPGNPDPLEARKAPRDHGPLMLAVALAAVLLVVRVLSPVIPDTGDGVTHYQFARQFWHHAHAALSQWGKPVFSLLSSPFTALGLWGMTAFNALVAVGTCAVLMGCLEQRRQRLWWWAVPVLLLTAPVYVHTVVRGLTEPLFGLFSIAVVLLLLRRQEAWAMLVASFLPFVRPEYAAFAPYAVAVVAWRRRWKALPWLACGIVVYGLFSAALLGKPFAFFLDHTYAGVDIYGRGDPWSYLDNADVVYGAPLKSLICASLVLFGVLLWRDAASRQRHLLMGALTLLPAASIIALHSYALWRGGLGSLGLLRVMATTVPLLVLFIVHVSGSVWALFVPDQRWATGVFAAGLLLYGNVGYHELLRQERLPIADNEEQRLQREAAAYVNAHREPGQRTITLDPVIMLLSDADPWDSAQALPIAGFRRLVAERGARAGDWIVWDAHFGPNEGGVPIDSLQDDLRFKPIAAFRPKTPLTTLGGGPYWIQVFQRTEGDWVKTDTLLFTLGRPSGLTVERCDSLPGDGAALWLDGGEYPFTLSALPIGVEGWGNEELVVRTTTEGLGSADTVRLVLAVQDTVLGTIFEDLLLRNGDQEFRVPMKPRPTASGNKLYLWNATGRPVRLARFEVSRTGSVDR